MAGTDCAKCDATAADARRGNVDWLLAVGDGPTRRAQPFGACHAIFAPDDLGWRTEQLANIILVHGPRCSAVAAVGTTTPLHSHAKLDVLFLF